MLTPKEPKLHGLLARFGDEHETLAAAARVCQQGYRATDAYTPFPVEGLSEALGFCTTRIALIVLLFGIAGGLTGFGMCWYANVVSYPLNIGGRPYNSWPAFIAITFELTVLFAGLSACFGMLILNGLPQLYHPLFNVPDFDAASRNGFFLCIEAKDPHFELQKTRTFLESLHPQSVVEVYG